MHSCILAPFLVDCPLAAAVELVRPLWAERNPTHSRKKKRRDRGRGDDCVEIRLLFMQCSFSLGIGIALLFFKLIKPCQRSGTSIFVAGKCSTYDAHVQLKYDER